MKRIVLILMLVLPSLCQADGLGIREYELGTHKNDLPGINTMFCTKDGCLLNHYSIRDVDVQMFFSFNKEDILNSIAIAFERKNYAKIYDALIDKWGEPTLVKTPVWTNMRGDKLDNIFSAWQLPEGVVTALYISSKINESSVSIRNSDASKDFAEKKQQQKALPGF